MRETKQRALFRRDFKREYTYEGKNWLYLERLGSHSKIFGM